MSRSMPEREVAVNELHELFAAAFVELADDGDVLNLLVGEFAVGAVNLSEDVARIDEEDAVVVLPCRRTRAWPAA